MEYTVYYEIGVGKQIIKDTMLVSADDPERAVWFCGEVLDQEHNQGENENDVVLLECRVISQDEATPPVA